MGDVNYSLISAVRERRLEDARRLIDYYGLSYSQAWSDGYILLCTALENEDSAMAKLLLTKNCKVNKRNNRPSMSPLHLAVANDDIEIIKMLLDKAAYINAKTERGSTPLHTAVRNKNIEVTELLLKYKADVSARGESALHLAVEIKCLQIVEHLLEYGADVNCTSNAKNTPLHLASTVGDIEIVKILLNKGADINATTNDNSTPLHIATKAGHHTNVKLLLQNGAKVDNQDKDDKTALDLAVENGYLKIVKHILKYCPDINNQKTSLKIAVLGSKEVYKDIVEALLEYGFSVTPEDANNSELLRDAVEKGYLRIVEDLLKFGADVNMLFSSTFGDFTLLHIATKKKKKELAQLLIKYGANINARDSNGRAPIFNAIKNADLKMAKLLLTNGADIKNSPDLLHIAVMKQCIEIVEALLQVDLFINAKDKRGRTALHFTVPERHDYKKESFIRRHIVELLLSKGANVDAQTKYGVTTLHAACYRQCEEVVEVLLKYNANVNCSTVKRDITPLNISIERGNERICMMLLEKGADVNAKRKDGSTALHLGAGKSNEKIVETLLKFGANFESRDEKERTALHVASKISNEKVVKSLLKCGADIESRDEKGRTALHIASKKSKMKIIKTLLKFGANIDSREGRTALHIASKKGIIHVVFTLLKYGSDVNITCNNYLTPLSYANASHASRFSDEYYEYKNYISDHVHNIQNTVVVLQHHIFKMKIANLYVSEQNLKSFGNVFESSRSDEFEEIKNMKRQKISNSNISFYDILAKSTISLASYMRNENIVQVLKSDDYETKFPIYASMIKSHFRKGMRRKELLDQVNTIFYFPYLPYNCTENIFSYLSDQDLKILINGVKPLSIRNLNTNINNS